jgi:hypothetical protein
MKLDAYDILEALGFEFEEWDFEEHDHTSGYYLKRDGEVLMEIEGWYGSLERVADVVMERFVRKLQDDGFFKKGK